MTAGIGKRNPMIPAALQATDMVVAGKLWDVNVEMVHLADGMPAET